MGSPWGYREKKKGEIKRIRFLTLGCFDCIYFQLFLIAHPSGSRFTHSGSILCPHHASVPFVIVESLNHRIAQVGRDPYGSSSPTAGSTEDHPKNQTICHLPTCPSVPSPQNRWNCHMDGGAAHNPHFISILPRFCYVPVKHQALEHGKGTRTSAPSAGSCCKAIRAIAGPTERGKI